MYNSYNSLRDIILKDIDNQKSVLNKFPEHIARPITQSCSKYLSQFTSHQWPFKSDKPSSITSSSDTHKSLVNTNSSTNQSTNLTNNELNNDSALSNLTNLASNEANLINNTINTQNNNQNLDLFSENSTNENLNININNNQTNTNENSEKVNIIQLDSIEQVNWTLENLMYGLTLGLEYQEIIKDCWNVYHDWLSVLLDEPKQFLPQAIRDDPINYSRKMLWHLYHLFTPRNKEQHTSNNKTNELTKHVMMCHSVLVVIETIAKDSKLLQQDLWEDVLKWLLAINDSVLAQPFNKEDFGEILSSRIVATLFEIWLIACNKNFPSPSLWKTFQEFCANWRHHIPLVTEWNRVCYALTQRLLELTWWPDFASSKNQPSISDTNAAYDILGIINSMNTDTVMQAWFRFFHIIGRPLDFCDQVTIQKLLEQSRQQRLLKEYESSSTHSNKIEFACIKKLPVIFLEFIKGISRIVDLFLGITSNLNSTTTSITLTSHSYASPSTQKTTQQTPTSMLEQKARSKSVMVHSTQPTQTTSLQQQQVSITNSPLIANLTQLHQTDSGSRLQYLFKTNRPSVNSLLHLVGHWLFEAAIKYLPDKNSTTVNETNQSENYAKLHNQYNRDFVLGQAEAYGILCKIFCSVKTNEKILPEYLSRFYSVMLLGLKVPTNFGDLNPVTNEYDSGEILGSIIVNGHNMFKLDLDGINILHMPMLNALNAVFKLKYPVKEDTSTKDQQKPKELVKSIFHIGFSSISLVELKRYCIYLFSSLLCLANHLNTLPIYDRDLNMISNQNFFSLRSKILEIFLAAMSNEQDTINLQMLFGCGRLIVGEWSMDEMSKTSPIYTELIYVDNKKERLSYCFNQVVSLICAPLKINNSTLQNHSFALAIFDSLSSIAAGDIINEDESVIKLAISWIWHYVKTQIKRRSREHTKEMHSVIVAAYNCLIILLVKKPNLLRDKQTLQTVTNCIEIGISGSSSYPTDQKLREESKESSNLISSTGVASTSGTTLMKSEKELKPASLRVKEAAESVLYFMMEHTSNFTPQSDSIIDSIRIQLNEKVLSELVNENLGKFKYFAIDGTLVIAVLDKSLLNTPSSKYPTVTVLLRGPFNCQAWSLHLRNSPFSQSLETANIKINTIDTRSGNTLRNVTNKIDQNISSKTDEIELIRHAVPKCELSIPSLNDVASKCVKNLNKFHRFKEEQIEFETKAIENSYDNSRTYTQHIDSCLNLKSCQKFQSARMFLSHLGFSALESTTRINNKDDLPEIISIDSSDHGFLDQLSLLDNLPTRTFASCSIFYVRKNQTNSKSILENIQSNSTDLDENFYSFLHSIGTIIDINNNNTNSTTNDTGCIKKINKLNGVDNVFYWSDISSELVFYLPNGKPNETEICLDETFKIKSQSVPSDIKVMIVWLEQMQDCDSVPVDELVHEVNNYESLFHPTVTTSYQKQPKEIIILFIHPLKSKLNRIITWSNVNKKYFYTMPLVDGMVVSSRMLSSMVRQTVMNIFRRKRLEIDDYQPPHVRRKNKISELIKKFQSKKSEADFYTSLLME